MTIEDLAVITQQGFVGLEDRVNKRFDNVEGRLDRIENTLYLRHDNRLDKIEDKLLQIQVILGKKLE